MKKTILALIVIMMLLSVFAMLAIPVTAAEIDGDWITSRRANDYDDEQNYSHPAAGYKYTTDGFVTVSPDYTNCTVYQQVHTRNKIDLQGNNDGNGNAISLTFTILEYPYAGETNEDQWIAITLNSEEKANQGSVDNGEGLCILIRRLSYDPGKAQAQYHYVDKDGKGFSAFTLPDITVPVNEQGQEIYTFSMAYDGTNYIFNLCGTETKDEHLNQVLSEKCAEGAYLGVTMHSGVSDAKASMLISNFQGEIPFGDDSAEPQPNVKNFAPIADSSTVEANQPAVLWDSTCRDFDKMDTVGATLDIQENGTVKLTTQTLAPYIFMGVKSEISYEAAEFPYIAVLTKDCYADGGNIYYCAGKVLAAKQECYDTIDLDDYTYGDGWSLGIYDLSEDEDWVGRINAIRIGFHFTASDLTDEDYNNFTIGFYGAFRSEDEAIAYAEAYMMQLNDGELPTEEPTTERPTTHAPESDPAQQTTEKNENNQEKQTADTSETAGCKSLISMQIISILILLGCAVTVNKKYSR